VKTIRELVGLALMALGVAALVQQLKRPQDQRTWHGEIVGVPYEFRPPTLARLQERWWNPEDSRLLTPHVFGVGWSVNLYEARRRLMSIADADA
jgi:hypothetical protein